MAVSCPSCHYSPIGPYVDNCPICAEQVRNVAVPPKLKWWKYESTTEFQLVALAIAAVIAVALLAYFLGG
jgi:hypothetical protein